MRRCTSAFLFFTLRPNGQPITDMSLGRIVSEILNTIGATDVESPRTLRNTFCRRQLLAGRPREEVSQMLGLASNRTCDRIFATIVSGSPAPWLTTRQEWCCFRLATPVERRRSTAEVRRSD